MYRQKGLPLNISPMATAMTIQMARKRAALKGMVRTPSSRLNIHTMPTKTARDRMRAGPLRRFGNCLPCPTLSQAALIAPKGHIAHHMRPKNTTVKITMMGKKRKNGPSIAKFSRLDCFPKKPSQSTRTRSMMVRACRAKGKCLLRQIFSTHRHRKRSLLLLLGCFIVSVFIV